MPHDTSTLDKTERVPFVITYNTALRSISSIIGKHVHFHILISSPRCYNLFKATPIVAYRRRSNLSDFLVRAKLRNPTQHSQPSGAHTHVEKTVLLVNTYLYLTQKLHTHSTLQVKPDLSLITSTITQKTSFTRYNATTAPNNTQVKTNDDSKTVSTNTADQLTPILVISPNPPQSQNTFLLMITLLTTSHLFH